MRMTVSFVELNEVLTTAFEDDQTEVMLTDFEDEQPFDVDLGELSVMYDGQNGATFTPAVSADGVISWTNNRDLPNPDPICIKGADGKDGTQFVVDQTLTLENGMLSVNTVNVVEADNTLPVTSAAVNVTVGNINALLATI